ncbi:MAG: GNAT family N-acetyltransferase, partial [Pseudomonadales bacterium]|nr:GNAT family N-acetyltransferase [Pseudomonadales bacterium]
MPQGQPEQPADLSFEFITSITSVTASEWNGITGTDYPFTRYEFLQALESSGATRRESGWQPHHLLIRHCEKQQPPRLIGVMPLFLKWHSYGEYVFDFAWAEAYQRYGLDYYPKLVSAIPFTPATGPRLCLSPGFDRNRINSQVFEALKQQAETLNVSSWHLLFPTEADSHSWQAAGAPQRLGVQFHCFNN